MKYGFQGYSLFGHLFQTQCYYLNMLVRAKCQPQISKPIIELHYLFTDLVIRVLAKQTLFLQAFCGGFHEFQLLLHSLKISSNESSTIFSKTTYQSLLQISHKSFTNNKFVETITLICSINALLSLSHLTIFFFVLFSTECLYGH